MMADMSSSNLTAALAESEQLLNAAINECVLKLNALPANPAAKAVSESPRAFVVSSKDVFSSDRWDPFYHHWGMQYDLVKALVISRKFAALRLLLEGQTYEDRQHGRVRLAPAVIEHVKTATGDLVPAAEKVPDSKAA